MLHVEGLSKTYRGFASFRERLGAALTLGLYSGSQRYDALHDVSFRAGAGANGRGEILGVIGANGAGKSTLLRILSGVSRATRGRVHRNGSVRSVLELGVGFNGDLTGRENVYYNGRLWGYSGRALLTAMDSILDFARLREHADRPLAAYSTGMQMRLGFSLATFERADLLLIDEALAVGDASFQQQCVRRFETYRDAGSLIIVVSHDLHMLQAVSDRILLLDRGRLRALGPPAAVVEEYMHTLAESSFGAAGGARPSLGKNEYRAALRDASGRERALWFTGERTVVALDFTPGVDILDATVGLHISDRRGVRAFGINTHLLGLRNLDLQAGVRTRVCFDLSLNLGAGGYSLGLSVHRGATHLSDCYLWEEHALDFEVEIGGGPAFEGIAYLEPAARVEIN